MKTFLHKFLLISMAVSAANCSVYAQKDTKAETKAKADQKQEAPKPLILQSKALKDARRVNTEKYPDADSVLVRDIQKVTYQADGSSDEFDEFYKKILTEKGKRNSGVFREYFNKSYGKVTVWAIDIIKPDGKITKIDIARNSKVMISPGQMGANIYNPNSKILSVTVPGIEIGDTIRYFVQRTTFMPRMKNIWTNMFILQSTTPVIYYKVEINGPENRPLKKILVKDKIKDSVEATKQQKDGRIIYTWTFKDVPRIFPEPNMPASYLHSQRLLVSTAASWQEISKWYDKLCEPHLEKVTPEMKAKVAELIKGLKTEEEKIEAIFRFVSTKIRYMGLTIETTAPGYEPHDIDITFKNRYGVCRDKAALLSGMLRLAGIKSYPVLIMAGTKKDKEVPNNYFNHAITCAITSKGKTVLMDSTDESTREILPAYLSDKSYLPAKPEGSDLLTSPVVPAAKNMLKAETSGKFSEDGSLKASTVLKFDGINDTIYRGAFSRWKAERIKQFFATRLKAMMPGAKLESFKITPKQLRDFKRPLKIEFSFSTKSLLANGQDAMLLKVPQPGSTFGAVHWFLRGLGLRKRQYPLMLPSTCGISENFTYKLPKSLKPVKLPGYPEIDWKKLVWKRSLKYDKNQLSGNSEYLLNAVEFSPKEYLTLKADVKKIQFQNRKMLVLKKDFSQVKDLKKLFPTAPSVIVSQKSLINITSPTSYTTTTKIKKKILNYAGVKHNSEIKLYYNPSWRQASVSSVKVTSPDGKEFKLDKTESNIMDQSWNGSAPRYPGGKILVVSLPGVQIGSEVEYEVKVKNTKQPLLSTIVMFQNGSPIINKEVSVRYPEKLDVNISASSGKFSSSIKKQKGFITKTWESGNIGAIAPEMRTPPKWFFAPRLEISIGNWKAYSANLKKQLEKAADKQPKTEKLALKLTSGKEPEQAMLAIRDYVARKIRAAGPGLNGLPIEYISNADTTLEAAYGNSSDRAVLIYTMLKKAGFKPEFIAVASVTPVPEAMTNLKKNPANDFYSVLVKLEHDGKKYYFNDTSQYAKLGSCRNEGRIILNLDKAELDTLKPSKGMEDLVKKEYSLKLMEDGSMLISSTTLYYGSDFEGSNRFFAEVTPENRKRHFQELVAGIAQSAVPITKFTSDFSSYPGKVHFAVKIPDYVVSDGKYQYFKLPQNELKYLISTGMEKRETPYIQSGYVNKQVKYSISLPENIAEIAIKPENSVIKYPAQGGKIAVSTSQSSTRSLEINYDINLKPCIVPADEYVLLLNAQNELSKPGADVIMLVTK